MAQTTLSVNANDDFGTDLFSLPPNTNRRPQCNRCSFILEPPQFGCTCPRCGKRFCGACGTRHLPCYSVNSWDDETSGIGTAFNAPGPALEDVDVALLRYTEGSRREMSAFLVGSHHRLGARSAVRKLPVPLLKKVACFLLVPCPRALVVKGSNLVAC